MSEHGDVTIQTQTVCLTSYLSFWNKLKVEINLIKSKTCTTFSPLQKAFGLGLPDGLYFTGLTGILLLI